MHELTIVHNIVDIVLEQMKIHRLSRIERIILRVGVMRGLSAESLKFGFDAEARGTPVEGADLVVEMIPIRGRCVTCHQDFTMDQWLEDCPSCKNPGVEIISGKELEIASIEGC